MYRRFLALSAGFSLGLLLCVTLTVAHVYWGAPSRYNILVIGSDQRGDERARSDVLFVVSIPKRAGQPVLFLSIPRDTLIQDSTYGMQKITHFYALGDRPDDGKLLGNVDLTKQAVEQLVNVHVDATVEVTFSSFQEIVNNLGGATLHGATVSGDEALGIVRDRFTAGRSDFSRQADEREVMQSLIAKINSPSQVRVLLHYFKNNQQARFHYSTLSGFRFGAATFLGHGGHLSLTSVDDQSIPGTGQTLYTPDFGQDLYYWVPDADAVRAIHDQYFN